jgi:hypothetical protein
MRPWQHARSSSAKTGRDWQADLPIHEFIDITKAAHADLRHRMVLHNVDLGPALAARAFPDRADAVRIAEQHVVEDMHGLPALADWLACCDLARLPRPSVSDIAATRAQLLERAVAERGLVDDAAPRAVFDLLTQPLSLCPTAGAMALAVLCNSIGPAIVRHVLGPPREVAARRSGTAIFDPAWTAEAMIWWMMGKRIPPLSEVVRCVRAAPGQRQGRAACASA